MVREKVKAKKARLSPQQCFSLDEDSKSDQELMELYEVEQSKESASENLESLETMLEAEDISDASARLEEYSQRYDQDEEMAQCVPELVIYTPVDSPHRDIEAKRKGGPRVKVTPTRKDSPKKAQKRKIKTPKKSTSVAPSMVESEPCYNDEFPKAKKEGTWIQCSKNECLKWRKLSNDIEPSKMPDRWICAMNTDSSRTECTASQETCDSELDFDVVYTPFVAGSLVWAKVPGYPWWPGMVEDDPDYNCCYETDDSNVNPISYHVSFIFDKEVSRSWVSYVGMKNFSGTENPNETGPKQKKYAKSLSKALSEARKAINLSLPERISKYSFNVLYKGQVGYQTDENAQKESKVKKRKQPKTTKSPVQKKTKANKAEKKTVKSSSLTDSENGSSQSQCVVKKNVQKRKRVLASSDEEESEGKKDIVKEIEEEITPTSEIQTGGEEGNTENETSNYEVSPHPKENSQKEDKNDTDLGKSKKGNVKSTKNHKPTQTKSETPKKKKRKSTTSKGEKQVSTITKSPDKTSSQDQSKVKKKKLKKSEEGSEIGKLSGMKSKKKSKFVNPCAVKPSNVSNNGTVNEDNLDGLNKETSFDEEISHVDEPNVTESKNPSTVEEKITTKIEDSKASSGKKKPTPFKPKKKKLIEMTLTKKNKDPSETKVSVVKPKKFELSLAFGKKEKPTSMTEKKIRKIKPKNSSVVSSIKAANQQENATASEIALEGSSVKPNNAKTSRSPEQKQPKTSKAKKMKQAFGKFKAPVKTSSKVTPAQVKSSSKANDCEKLLEKSAMTLEDALEIPESDDPRKNPENYVSIDSLEKDIHNLYQELSETAASNLMATDDADLTEASDCVTMEFLDEEISGNATQQNISVRRLTDSPEF